MFSNILLLAMKKTKYFDLKFFLNILLARSQNRALHLREINIVQKWPDNPAPLIQKNIM